MPTDPFVNPDLDDRPRHRQNLPPGVALPPAGHWVPGRPGDLPLKSRDGGPLRGTPGPNVGYAYTLAERVRSELQLAHHEDADDAVAVIAEIAGKRAASFGRAPVITDVELAVDLLGYDGSADADFAALRARLVHGAAHEYAARRGLVDSVPTELLRRPRGSFADAIGPWRAQLAGAHAGVRG